MESSNNGLPSRTQSSKQPPRLRLSSKESDQQHKNNNNPQQQTDLAKKSEKPRSERRKLTGVHGSGHIDFTKPYKQEVVAPKQERESRESKQEKGKHVGKSDNPSSSRKDGLNGTKKNRDTRVKTRGGSRKKQVDPVDLAADESFEVTVSAGRDYERSIVKTSSTKKKENSKSVGGRVADVDRNDRPRDSKSAVKASKQGPERVKRTEQDKMNRSEQQWGQGGGRKGVERKPLGKLVNTNLRDQSAKPKGSGQNAGNKTPVKSALQGTKETVRQSAWGSPINDRVMEERAELPIDWKESGEESVEERELMQTYIFRLSKKSMKFPRAKYYCRLCNYHIDSLPKCWEHIDQSRHNRLAKAKESENFFKNMEPPSPLHAKALGKLLEDVVEEHALSGSEMNMRKDLAKEVELVLQSHLPDCKIRVYGSSLSSFGFHDSDVNLDVEVPGEKSAAKILVIASQAIADKVDEDFIDFEPDFEGKHPCVRFRHKKSNLLCEVGTGNQPAIQTSQLLVEYNQCDSRLRPLVMGLRYWARLCGIDQQAIGTMPAYTFVLLVIYFLQHCDPPVLPVLQEKEKLKIKNKSSLGELWVDLLRFYLVGVNIEEIVVSIRHREPISRNELKLPNRRIAIEDPFANGKKNVAKSLTTSTVFQYVMDRLHDALKYFGIPQNGHPAEIPAKSVGDTTSDEDSFKKDKTASCKALTRKDKNGHTPEDGIRDVACEVGKRTEVSHQMHSHPSAVDCAAELSVKLAESVLSEVEQEEASSLSEGLSQLMSGEVGSDAQLRSETSISDSDSRSDGVMPVQGSDHVDMAAISEEDCLTSSDLSGALGSDDDTNTEDNGDVTGSSPPSVNGDELDDEYVARTDRLDEIAGRDNEEKTLDGDYIFVFDQQILTRGEKVQPICTNCLTEGHVSKDCPEDALPPLQPLPKMDPKFLQQISALCQDILDRNQLWERDIRNRDFCVLEIEDHIRRFAFEDAKLSLFGSSRNGFGFRQSDLDICLTFRNMRDGEVLDVVSIIERLAVVMKNNRNFYNIVPIPTAKVPIIKFVHRPTNLEGDISLYNTLAQRNTSMLYTYACIDPRVRILGYTTKLFAKICDIGDASKGSLSSYAYTLLTIYFLQQRNPPVLPVLQELYEGDTKPVDKVDGCNAWFFSHLDRLPRVWKEGGCNHESVGSLWLGLLRFYTEEFDFTKYVVSIKQKKPLTRFEKLWMTPQRGIAIEDPFDLDHNLGSAASRKMAMYIIQVFRHAREHFGTPRKINFDRRHDPMGHMFNYFMNVNILTGGQAPPNDRGCRICGKIGHFVKDCPIKKKGMERKELEKRDRERREQRQQDLEQRERVGGTPQKGPKSGGKVTGTPNTKQAPPTTPNLKSTPIGRNVTDPKGASPKVKQVQQAEASSVPQSSPQIKVSDHQKSTSSPQSVAAGSNQKPKPASGSEKTKKDVARELYPIKPTPVKKSAYEASVEGNNQKSATPTSVEKGKAPSADLQSVIQQQQDQQRLAAAFQIIGKSQPPSGQQRAPTQPIPFRQPTTPTNMLTVDQLEKQLKMEQQRKQQQQQQQQQQNQQQMQQQQQNQQQMQQQQQILPPGAKTLEQLEQQLKQDQFLQNQRFQKQQQVNDNQQQHHNLLQLQQQQVQQQHHPSLGGGGPTLQSSKVVGPPPAIGPHSSEPQQEDLQSDISQQRLQSQSQPIPVGHRTRQTQWQQQSPMSPTNPLGWGSPVALSPPHGDWRYHQTAVSPPQHYVGQPLHEAVSPSQNYQHPFQHGRNLHGSTSSPGMQHGGYLPQHQRHTNAMSPPRQGQDRGIPIPTWQFQPQLFPMSPQRGPDSSPLDQQSPDRPAPIGAQPQSQHSVGPGIIGQGSAFPQQNANSSPFHFSPSAINPNLPRPSHAAPPPSVNQSSPLRPHPQHQSQLHPQLGSEISSAWNSLLTEPTSGVRSTFTTTAAPLMSINPELLRTSSNPVQQTCTIPDSGSPTNILPP